MRCFFSASLPAPLAAVTATARRPPSMPVHRREHHQHCQLQLRPRRPGKTTALRQLRCPVVRAQSDRNVQPPLQPNYFVEETELISRLFRQTFCTFEGCLYKEAIEMSASVCLSAKKAVTMASQIEDSARLTTSTPGPQPQLEGTISADTVHLTLRAYVDVFVRIAEDSYDRRVSVGTATSFLEALRGLVSISHILLDAALEALSRTHPRESLAEYAFNCDVKSMRREFDCQMAHLEHGIRRARSITKACELVLPTILEGMEATKSLLGVMAVRRQRALGKANKVVT